MKFNTLSKVVLAGVIGSLIACAPAKQNSVNVGANDTAIIGGVNVDSSDVIAKSTVAIIADVKTKDGQEGQFICTGTLMTSNIVLTAGHCIPSADEYATAALYIVFGTDLNKLQKGDVRLVVDSVVHPQYGKTGSSRSDTHDLSLIKFAGPVAPGYQAAQFLDDESLLTEGTVVTLAGFGINKTDGKNTESDNRLSKVDVEIAGDLGKNEVIVDQRFGKGACHGDSGGPAFLNVKGTLYVWGVTSRGGGKNGVDDCSLAGVYTKVKSENTFVQDALKQLSAK